MNTFEMGVTYNPAGKWEPLPAPKFENVEWLDIPEENALVGQRLLIGGDQWEITVAGFQGSKGPGKVQLHPEGALDGKHDHEQEDVYFLSGHGEMSRWDGLDCIMSVWSDTPLKEVLTLEEVGRARFTLAVASYYLPGIPETELEHMVLNVEVDSKTIPVEPIMTPPGHYHATHLTDQSLYFVVKRKRI